MENKQGGFWKDVGQGMLGGLKDIFIGLPGSIFNGITSIGQGFLEDYFSRRAWRRYTEYNSPTAQMERLKQAGLNPNLMYTQGNTGNASAPYQAPKFDAMSKQMNAIQMAGQIYAIRNQTKETDASVNLKQSQADYYEAMKNLRILDHEYYNQANPLRIANLAYQGNYLQAMKTQAEERTRQIWLDSSLHPLRKMQLTRQIKKAEKEIRLLGMQYNAVQQNIRESISRVGINNVKTQMLIKEKEKLEKDLAYYDEYLRTRNSGMKIQNRHNYSSMYESARRGYLDTYHRNTFLGKDFYLPGVGHMFGDYKHFDKQFIDIYGRYSDY